MTPSNFRFWGLAALFGLGHGLACTDAGGDDGASACVGGEFCPAGLECVDGLCVEPAATETGDATTGGDGDGDATTSGDGDGDTITSGDGDGDGDTTTSGDGDGDCAPGSIGCMCEGGVCDEGLACIDGTCVGEFCGNGVVDPGEACDDGNDDNSDACLDTCVEASCGDGYVGPGEGCDDGNDIDDDGCTSACALPGCGDGIVSEGEGCDDGNDDDNDACLNACVEAICGDGVVWDGQEACDDANEVETDACLPGCVAASCGDGIVWAGQEACDDQNEVTNDGCESDCLATEIVDFDLFERHACVVNPLGELRCWGANDWGQLGLGHTQNIGDGLNEIPPPVIDAGGPVAQVATGVSHTCALLVNGEVRCWGRNSLGTLGLGHLDTLGDGPNEMPTAPVPGMANLDIVDIDAGDQFTCVLTSDGEVYCWGRGGSGRLGTGIQFNVGVQPGQLPPPPSITGGVVTALSLSEAAACVLLEDETIRCWGSNTLGQAGSADNDGNIGEIPEDLPAAPLALGDGTPIGLDGGKWHYCAYFAEPDEYPRCWGSNNWGQLGQGHSDDIGRAPGTMPPAPTDVDGVVIAISAGTVHSCAVLEGGEVRCWGNNQSGAIGQQHPLNYGDQPGEMPTPLVDIDEPVVRIRAGAWTNLVITQTGALRVWGSCSSGQCATGNTSQISPFSSQPVVIGLYE